MAQVSVGIGIGLPGVSIGINLPVYPELVRVPGYPVYYAPRLNSNFFFYDGMYWVYQGDNWYASSWYNGPWGMVGPESVPLFVLRIPVRYYRTPPAYFRGWQPDAPPRWGEHWGHEWEQQRSGWDRWNRSSAPAPAPLPVYQRQYSGDRYPQAQQQQQLHSQNYRYQPRDAVVRQQYQEQARQRAPAPAQRGQQGAPQERSPAQKDMQRSNPQQPIQQSPRAQPPQRGGEEVQKSAPTQAPAQPRGQAVQDQSSSSHSRVRASASSRRQGQARRIRRQAREHRRSKGRGRVRREAAPKMRNEVRVASKVRGAPSNVLCSRRLDWRHLAIDTQPPCRFSAHKLNADSTAPIPLSLRPSAWRRADVPLPCRPETAPASECCGC